jgi:hypothetical protein
VLFLASVVAQPFTHRLADYGAGMGACLTALKLPGMITQYRL